VALPRIFVIDDSEAVRETLSIVLGNVGDVRALSFAECTESFPIPDANPHLVVANGDNVPPQLLRAISRFIGPVIWLRGDPAQGPPLPITYGSSLVAPYRFDAHALIDLVHQSLRRPPPRQPTHTGNKLAYPYLTQEASMIAREARASRLPVMIVGEPGTGRARVAASLHADDSTSRFIAMAPQSCTRTALEELSTGGWRVSLFVDDVAAITCETQALLLEIAETGGLAAPKGWLDIRLITATATDLGTLTQSGVIPRELAYRLSVLPIQLTPLRDRAPDIPPLVRAVAADLCSALGCQPVAFTPRAMERLTRYLWFGNTAELETVLARTIALVHKEVLDAGDLLFGYGRLMPSEQKPQSTREVASPTLATTAVDLIINELAHEFKNPLVTIKTFAQHLDRLLEEEGGRDQLLRLTGEAVDRMDRALENLLQFTRFQEPAVERVPLGALLGPLLADLGSELTEHRLVLDYRPPPTGLIVSVDPVQLSYALDNLLRTLIRSVADGQSISVVCSEPATVTFHLPSGNGYVVAKLRRMLSPRSKSEESPLPLGLALARSLITRNDGQFDVEEDAAGLTIRVELPIGEEMGRGSGKYGATTGSDR
jgi:two-component system, NtrC family, response regulator HydG